MNKKRNTPILLAIILIASFVLAACGDATPVDATLACSSTCKAEVTNNSDETLKYYIAIEYVPEGAEVDASDKNVNPQRLPWQNVMYMESKFGHFELEAGKTHTFEWTTGRSGLYRIRLSSFDKNKNTVNTEVYAYYKSQSTKAPEEKGFELKCNDDHIIMHVDAGQWQGKGTVLYANDARFLIFQDAPDASSELAIPLPIFTIESPYINVQTQKWDNYLELNRDEHSDPKNADFCAIPYSK